VSSNPVHDEVYSIQHYVIKWLATGRWFSPVSSTSKTDRNDTTEILLKVALSTINPNHQALLSSVMFCYWSACSKEGTWAVEYICISVVAIASLYHFSNGYWNCSDSVVFFLISIFIPLKERNYHQTRYKTW
jgi:hypothetical protein